MNSLKIFKPKLFNQGSLVRWIRLVAGLFFAVQAVQIHDTIAGFIAAMLLVQAFTNTGCGVGGCAVPASNKKSNITPDVEYQEIK